MFKANCSVLMFEFNVQQKEIVLKFEVNLASDFELLGRKILIFEKINKRLLDIDSPRLLTTCLKSRKGEGIAET